MEKIHSGIEGFDKLVYGGLPKGRSYLVAGEPGTPVRTGHSGRNRRGQTAERSAGTR